MYALYEKKQSNGKYKYKIKKQVSLFGCNAGYIPYLLQSTLFSTTSEPYPWHLNVDKALSDVGLSNSTLIINLKPNNVSANLSLYELVDVWGYSDSGWTPLMLCLRGLFVDANPRFINDEDFTLDESEVDYPIFSMLYLAGTVKEGKIVGKWTAPRPSPTNSALLWPESFKYFVEQANQVITRLS